MKKPILVFSDREGTVIRDEDYYLGSSKDWRKQIEFLPGAVEGIKIINSIPGAKFIMVTNQAGVALQGPQFDLLTEERMHQVGEEIVARLKNKGAIVNRVFYCHYVDEKYVKKANARGQKINPKYVNDAHPYLKPRIGMLEDGAKEYGVNLAEVKYKFMIGDRASDIETGLNGGCISILISSWKTKQLGDEEKVKIMLEKNPALVYIVKDFLEAVQLIEKFTYG